MSTIDENNIVNNQLNDQKPIYDNADNADYVNYYLHKKRNAKQNLKFSTPGIWEDGLFLLIKEEYRRVKFMIIFCLMLLIASVGWGISNNFLLNLPLEINVFPGIVGVLSIFKLYLLISEKRFLKKDILIHNNNIKNQQTQQSEEGLISKVYLNTQLNQIKHNWWLIFSTTYLSIATLLLWGLRDKHWYFLKFDVWIKNWFGNPNLILNILIGILIANVFLFIIFLVLRKHRSQHIEMYFGKQYILDPNTLDKIKNRHHKFYSRGYFIILFILLIIPIILSIYILINNHGKKLFSIGSK